jgi:hypothetical protein
MLLYAYINKTAERSLKNAKTARFDTHFDDHGQQTAHHVVKTPHHEVKMAHHLVSHAAVLATLDITRHIADLLETGDFRGVARYRREATL